MPSGAGGGAGERIVNSCAVPIYREKQESDAKREKINRQQKPTQPASKVPSAAFLPGVGGGHSLGPGAAGPAPAGVQDEGAGPGWPRTGRGPETRASTRRWLAVEAPAPGLLLGAAGEGGCRVTFSGAVTCGMMGIRTSVVAPGLGARRLGPGRMPRRWEGGD